jgi:hypothetical protein
MVALRAAGIELYPGDKFLDLHYGIKTGEEAEMAQAPINVPEAHILTPEFADTIIQEVAQEHGPIKYGSGKRGVRLEDQPNYKQNVRKLLAAHLEDIGLKIVKEALQGKEEISASDITEASKEILKEIEVS